MCLAVPGRIVSKDNGLATIDYNGVARCASLRFFENAKVGDYVLVHAGFVIQILDKESGSELDGLISETMGFGEK
jgi:hydrogenase expression/formation protein HypC